jgi:hypothetical protein
MKKIITVLVLVTISMLTNGCFVQPWSVFADVNKLGLVITPEQSVTIQSSIGPVKIEYISPRERRLVLNGETREFRLIKTAEHMGAYAQTDFKHKLTENISGINYGERTISFRSEEEFQHYLNDHGKMLSLVNQTENQLLVRCQVHAYGFWIFKPKELYVTVNKYEIVPINEKKPLWGYLYPVSPTE